MQQHRVLMFNGLLLLACLFFVIHLAVGPIHISWKELLRWPLGAANDQTQIILTQLRLPRTLLAASVGACLAVCGCATQGLFRNALADPSLIGVSAGASAGASLVIVFFSASQWNLLGLSLVSLGAFGGAIFIVYCVYRISSGVGSTSVSTMLLAGLAFSYLAGSLSSVLEYMADSEMLKRISLWSMGGLEGADALRASLMLSIWVLVYGALWRLANPLNVLLLGESEARHLGYDVERLRWQIVLCVALGVGCAVALAGTIAFVGLVVPHMARFLVGPNHRYLLPFSAALGACLLLIADTIARTIMAPAELPVGLLIAFIGAPLFISLIRQQQWRGVR